LDERLLESCRPLLPVPGAATRKAVAVKLAAAEDGYLVLHPGAGSSQKHWPMERWQALTDLLLADGHTLVFTGNTTAEQATVAALIVGRGGCVALCARLSWPEFVSVVADSRLLVGIDSVAGHVAAAVNVPCVVIGTGIPHPAHWRPRNPLCRVLTHPVPCSPC